MKKAVLAMTFGSPESYDYEGIAQFFTNIRRGVRPREDEIRHLYENYQKIGSSPLQEISRQEVAALAQELGPDYACYFANKFSSPFIRDVIKQMEVDGIEECICLILEPHFSYYSVMGYEKFLESETIRFHVIEDWYLEEGLLNFWQQEIGKIIEKLPPEESYRVLFSAHSVPVLALEFEDPYIDQVYENAQLLAQRLGLGEDQYTNTWQSESDIGIPWIKPDVLEYMQEDQERPDHYIFVPLAFISEHIEVLFDNDYECRNLCEELGVGYHRPPMPNNHPLLIQALANVVRQHTQGPFKTFQPEKVTFDELKPSKTAEEILLSNPDLNIPDFVKKLIEKKGADQVKIPTFIKLMLKKKGVLPPDAN